MKQRDDDLGDRLPRNPRGQAVALAIMLVELAMKIIEAFIIWFLGDPHWKAKAKIDWRQSILFRRPWTPSEKAAMRRAAEEEIHHEYDVNEHK